MKVNLHATTVLEWRSLEVGICIALGIMSEGMDGEAWTANRRFLGSDVSVRAVDANGGVGARAGTAVTITLFKTIIRATC